MIKFGLLFDKLITSQTVIGLILQLELLKNNNSDLAPAIFIEEEDLLPIKVNIPVYPIAEAYFSDYILLANSIGTANKLINFPNVLNKFYLIHFPEWLYMQNKKFTELNTIYNNNELILVVPSIDYQLIIKKTWNRESLLIENFSLEFILNYIRSN